MNIPPIEFGPPNAKGAAQHPVLAAMAGAVARGPGDLALIFPRAAWSPTPSYRWVAAGRIAPLSPRLDHWAPVEAFDVRVFVRADCRELVCWRDGPGREGCRWVISDSAHADQVRVAADLWDAVVAALSRQLGGVDGEVLRGAA